MAKNKKIPFWSEVKTPNWLGPKVYKRKKKPIKIKSRIAGTSAHGNRRYEHFLEKEKK